MNPKIIRRIESAAAGLKRTSLRNWAVWRLATEKFWRIDGFERAGAFAYNAFFSLFPLLVLFVTAAAAFIDRDLAGKVVISYVEKYIPVSGETQTYIFSTIFSVVEARREAGILALLILVWLAAQFFTTLVNAANRAWNIEGTTWWHHPFKSLTLLFVMAGAVLLGLGVPLLIKMADSFFPVHALFPWAYNLLLLFVPWLVLFFGLSFFYKLAPRRRTHFYEVRGAALCATILLLAAQNLFVRYLKDFSTLNAVYGAFGGIMALLLWIYVSGCVFIFCACLCAARHEVETAAKTAVSSQIRVE